MDFVHGYRFGMPFFIPTEYYDTRIQALDNISVAKGNHLIKAGVEWNRVESVQTFIGFCQWPLYLQLARWLSQLRRAGQRLRRGAPTAAPAPPEPALTGRVSPGRSCSIYSNPASAA